VTASDLRGGHVVWLAADDRWVRDIAAAELIEDEAHAALRLLHAQSQPLVVVGPYLAEARRGPHGPEPAHFREIFRSRGPTHLLPGPGPGPVQPAG
jgi:hypothetical protein